MIIKRTLLPFIAFIGFSISPTYSGDIISCDSFENCPDGSLPLTGALLALEAKIEVLEALLANVSRGIDPYTGRDTLTFTNMNVQVVSGSGTTDGAVNGTGNLIIGYNEPAGSDSGARTGSHMLVIGKYNYYEAFGGMVVGLRNATFGDYTSVSGGERNRAIGDYSSVSGGRYNYTIGEGASVSGGFSNRASGDYASVSGGYDRTADETYDWRAGSLFEDQ